MRNTILMCTAMVLMAAPQAWAGSSTPFLAGEQGGVIVAVMLNGKGPIKMLLDTGATHSAITADVVDQVGARILAEGNIISPAGAASRPIASVDSLSFGPVTVDIVLPSVAPPASFDAKGEIKGLVGQDVLAGLRYTLDFKRSLIEWQDGPARGIGIVLKLSFEQGRFLVALPQGSGVLRLVLDSGAGGLVLFDGPSSRRLPVVTTGETVELWTAVASRSAHVVRVPILRVGARTMRDVRGVLVTGEDIRPAVGDGLLPLHFFDRVTIDGPNRLLILEG